MLSPNMVLLLAFTSICTLVSGQGELVAELDYCNFAGAYSADYNISYWRKIPFGALLTGQNRFWAPQPSTSITHGTYNSTQSFDSCPERTVNGTEDFLYLGLRGRRQTKEQRLRPVVVNPNAHKLINASQPGVPKFGETKEDFVIEDSGFSNVPTQMLRLRCHFWLSVADEIPM